MDRSERRVVDNDSGTLAFSSISAGRNSDFAVAQQPVWGARFDIDRV
jgi:hypothetical protein